MRSQLHLILIFLAVCSLVPGCGDGKSIVKGTVSFDGQPVKSGSITFVSIEGDLVREGAVITDGAFTARLPPGKYNVELSAQRKAGTRTQKGFDGNDEVIQLTEELFPDYYNSKTELVETIRAGENVLTLQLKKKS